jgi:hypothetical protein
MDKHPLILIELDQSDDHILFLYDLLAKRLHSISHNTMPSFDDHRYFVLNHPYRTWLLVQNRGHFIGAIYLHTDNAIGINFIPQYYDEIGEAIGIVQARFKPLPALKSVRNGAFHVHVPAADIQLEKSLQSIFANKLQTTYILNQV